MILDPRWFVLPADGMEIANLDRLFVKQAHFSKFRITARSCSMRFSYYREGLSISGLLLICVFLSGCKSNAQPQTRGPAEVAFVEVRQESVVLTTELPGRTSACLVAEIRPQVSGLLQKRQFKEGTDISEGDLLYQIDPAPYQAAYDQAEAALSMAQAEIAVAEANLPAIRSRAERLKGLVEINAVGRQDYDDAAAALRQAEAALALKKTAVEVNRANMESARINLDYTPIRAPISGRIGKSNITVGAMVTAYQPTPLAVIQKLDPIYVDVTQANAELLRLRRRLESGELKGSAGGKKVRLLLEDGTPYAHEGTLQFRDVTVDPTTGSVSVRLVFSNPKQILLPGMFVRAIVEEGVNTNALLVPQQGITRDPKGNPVAYIVNGSGKVEQRMLTLDRAIKDKWLVIAGLTPGDKVIIEGVQNVRPGDTVRAVPFDMAPADAEPAAAMK